MGHIQNRRNESLHRPLSLFAIDRIYSSQSLFFMICHFIYLNYIYSRFHCQSSDMCCRVFFFFFLVFYVSHFKTANIIIFQTASIDFNFQCCYTIIARQRVVAQFGRALRSGRRGRRFKSCQPDHVVADYVSFATTFLLSKSSLTHVVAPPFRKKSRSVRLLDCKRARDGLMSRPTFFAGGGDSAASSENLKYLFYRL